MNLLASWTTGSHTANGVTHPTYRKGSGPGVIVIHEVPGITPKAIAFAEEVVARGFTVVMPSLFGRPEARPTVPESLRSIVRICVSREFSLFALGRTSPVATWLRSLARELDAELDGPGIGAIGMCLTGGFALAMLADAPIAAPVLAQPASPAPVGKARRADLGISGADLDSVKAKVKDGCEVLGLRYDHDPAVGTRFDTLRRELGGNFIAVEFPGRKHATLTAHRQQEAVDRVLAFLEQKLKLRKSRRIGDTQLLRPRSKERLPGALADGSLGRQIGAGAHRTSRRAGDRYRHDRPLSAAGTQIDVHQLVDPVDPGSREARREARRRVKREFDEPSGDLSGVDGLEPEAGRNRYHRQLRQVAGHRQDQVIELGCPKRGPGQAGLGHHLLRGSLRREVAEHRPVDRTGDGNPVGTDNRHIDEMSHAGW